jgi:peroxiredoxin Q/BCP
VSFDTVAENKAFADKFDFPYSLLCDTTKAMSIAYGAAADANAKYPARISYIVDDGKISWATEVTDIEQHVEEAVTRLTS